MTVRELREKLISLNSDDDTVIVSWERDGVSTFLDIYDVVPARGTTSRDKGKLVFRAGAGGTTALITVDDE
jgi:hypothetical protein